MRRSGGLRLLALVLVGGLLAACGGGSPAPPTAVGAGATTDPYKSEAPKAATAATAAPQQAPAPAAKAPPFKIKVGVAVCSAVCGFRYMALEKGYFAEQGLDVEYIQNQNNVNLTRALVAGEIDILEQNPSPAIVAAAKGQTKIAIVGAMNTGLAYVMFGKKSITSPKDLSGATVGISTPGALPHELVELTLKQENIDPKSMSFVAVGSDPQRLQALMAGKVDATPAPFDLGYLITTNPDLHQAFAFKDFLTRYVQNAIVARAEFAQKNPEQLAAFLAAYSKGVKYAIDHPDEAAQLVAKLTGSTPDKTLPGVQGFIKAGILNPGLALKTEQIQYMIDLGANKGDYPKFPAEQVFDPKYMEMAQKQM